MRFLRMQVTQRKGLVTTAGPWGSVTGKRYLQQTQCGAGYYAGPWTATCWLDCLLSKGLTGKSTEISMHGFIGPMKANLQI